MKLQNVFFAILLCQGIGAYELVRLASDYIQPPQGFSGTHFTDPEGMEG
jgi:hypothetical protein